MVLFYFDHRRLSRTYGVDVRKYIGENLCTRFGAFRPKTALHHKRARTNVVDNTRYREISISLMENGANKYLIKVFFNRPRRTE